jgi:hypothetical protein
MLGVNTHRTRVLLNEVIGMVMTLLILLQDKDLLMMLELAVKFIVLSNKLKM